MTKHFNLITIDDNCVESLRTFTSGLVAAQEFKKEIKKHGKVSRENIKNYLTQGIVFMNNGSTINLIATEVNK